VLTVLLYSAGNPEEKVAQALRLSAGSAHQATWTHTPRGSEGGGGAAARVEARVEARAATRMEARVTTE